MTTVARDTSVGQGDANVGIVRAVYDALNRADLDAWMAACDPAYVVHFPGVAQDLPLAVARQVFDGFFASFPGLQHTVQDAWGCGDRVAVHLVITGKHTGGPFQGAPPSGREFEVESLSQFRLANGRLVEQWIQYDALGMLQQLGLLPSAAQASAAGR